MYGYVAYHTAEEPPYRGFGGVRFRAVYVAEGESLRARLSARAAARRLAREGVRCAVFPADYPYCEVFARYGVAPPPSAPLYRATAAAIVRRRDIITAPHPSAEPKSEIMVRTNVPLEHLTLSCPSPDALS